MELVKKLLQDQVARLEIRIDDAESEINRAQQEIVRQQARCDQAVDERNQIEQVITILQND